MEEEIVFFLGALKAPDMDCFGRVGRGRFVYNPKAVHYTTKTKRSASEMLRLPWGKGEPAEKSGEYPKRLNNRLMDFYALHNGRNLDLVAGSWESKYLSKCPSHTFIRRDGLLDCRP
jgi:hypothetical protein